MFRSTRLQIPNNSVRFDCVGVMAVINSFGKRDCDVNLANGTKFGLERFDDCCLTDD